MISIRTNLFSGGKAAEEASVSSVDSLDPPNARARTAELQRTRKGTALKSEV